MNDRYFLHKLLVRVLPRNVVRFLVLFLRIMFRSLGNLIVLFGWIVFVFGAAYVYTPNLDPLLTPLAFVFLAIGGAIILSSRRLRNTLESLSLSPELAGRCILYFRSFLHDGSTPAARPDALENIPLFSKFGKLRRGHEEELAAAAPFARPLIALGSPGETLAPAGALRMYFSHSDWKEGVSKLLHECEIAILRTGTTPSLIDELGMLAQTLPPQRVVIFHEGDSYEEFRCRANRVFPSPLPAEWHVWWGPFLLFDEHWNPMPMPAVVNAKQGFNPFALLFGGRALPQEYVLKHQQNRGDYAETIAWLLERANGRQSERFVIREETKMRKK